jgi:predicted lipoprotein
MPALKIQSDAASGFAVILRSRPAVHERNQNISMALTRRSLLALFAAAALGGCKIVSNADLKAARSKSPDQFDAAAYVDQIWASKVVPEFKSRAIDLDVILRQVAKDGDKAGLDHGHREGDGNPWTYEIRGQGKIVAVDVASRHGIVTVEVQTALGPRKIDLQVGPVVFGTMLRDAVTFIKFGDFVNQIQYAQVSRALNDRATKGIRDSFDWQDAVGKTIAVYAAAVLGASEAISATPVIIEPATGEKP